jgi:hypothetical protein
MTTEFDMSITIPDPALRVCLQTDKFTLTYVRTPDDRISAFFSYDLDVEFSINKLLPYFHTVNYKAF